MRRGTLSRRLLWPAIALGAVFLVAACASTSVTPRPSSPTAQGGLAGTSAAPARPNETYIYVSSMGDLEFFNAHKYGWAWAGKTLGVNAKYVGPSANDVAAEVTAFDEAIAEHPAGIAVFAYDPTLAPEINKAWQAGIPVVTILGDLPDSDRIAYVGSPQHDLGYMGGSHIAKVLNGQGKLALLSIPGTAMFDQRAQGYLDAFKNYPAIQVVQTVDTKADTVTAINAAKSIMARFPDISGFICTDSTGGIGAATAVKEAGKAGQVKIVSMDRNADVLQLVQQGVITGTVAQDDAAMAFWAMVTLYNFNHHQAPLTVDNAKAGAVTGPSQVLMHVNWVDQSNVEYYLNADKMYAGATGNWSP